MQLVVTQEDVVWAEAGFRSFHDGVPSCWKWAVRGRHLKVVQAYIDSIGHNDKGWALLDAVGGSGDRRGNVSFGYDDRDLLTALLEHGVNPLTRDESGTSALNIATSGCRTGIVRTLLQKANYSQTDLDNALHSVLSSKDCHSEIALLLIRAGAQWKWNSTLLQAVRKQRWNLILQLIQRGMSFDSDGGREALCFFASRGNTEAVILVAGAWKRARSDDFDGALAVAAKEEHLTTVKWLLGSNTGYCGREKALEKAVALNRVDIAQLILTFGVSLEGKSTALKEAAKHGCLEVAEIIIRDVVPYKALELSMREAALHGRALFFQFLMGMGVPPPDFASAAKGGNLQIVRTLLNQPGRRGDEGLFDACQKGHLEIVQLILEHGAASDSIESYVFEAGAESGNVQILKELWTQRGVDVRAEDDKPLRWAVVKNREASVEALLEMGANARAKSSVALRTAVQMGHVEIVSTLLAAGADVEGLSKKELLSAAQVNRHILEIGVVDTTKSLWEDGLG